jgi:hypothetical protein
MCSHRRTHVWLNLKHVPALWGGLDLLCYVDLRSDGKEIGGQRKHFKAARKGRH